MKDWVKTIEAEKIERVSVVAVKTVERSPGAVAVQVIVKREGKKLEIERSKSQPALTGKEDWIAFADEISMGPSEISIACTPDAAGRVYLGLLTEAGRRAGEMAAAGNPGGGPGLYRERLAALRGFRDAAASMVRSHKAGAVEVY